MIGFALALLVSAPLAGQQQDARMREATCVFDGMTTQAETRQKIDEKAATAACKAQYGWNDKEAGLARMVAQGLLSSYKARAEAVKAGVDPKVIDEVYDSLTPDEIASFGWPGESIRHNSEKAMNKLIEALFTRVPEPDANLKAATTIIARAITFNMITAFLDLRDSRRLP